MLGQHYAPEEISGSFLAKELTEDLIKMGYQITYITCAPSYPMGKVYDGYRNRFFTREMMDGTRVIRSWSYISPKRTFWRRILNFGTFSATAFIAGLLVGKPEVMLSFSPPLPLGISAWVLSRVWRVPWILYVGDIYPEIAIVTGLLRNRAAISLFLTLERFLYRKADHIEVISEGFRENLQNKGVPPEKLSVIPMWADPDVIRPLPKENNFRQENGLSGKFVVMHAGNFGVNNSLEDLVEAADLLKADDGIRFVMVGEGEKKEEICNQVAQRKLKNVLFLPYQPRSAYETMLAAADVGLISLNPEAHYTSFPSKTLNIMASERAILAVVDDKSEIAWLVRNYNCGAVVPPARPDLLAQTIINLRGAPDQLVAWGQKGRQTLIQHFSRKHCIDLYDAIFRRINNEFTNR